MFVRSTCAPLYGAAALAADTPGAGIIIVPLEGQLLPDVAPACARNGFPLVPAIMPAYSRAVHQRTLSYLGKIVRETHLDALAR